MTLSRHAALTAVVIGLAGCSASVSVEQAFPPPLVEQLPLRMAIHYPPELTEFVHSEDRGPERKWTVQLGQANRSMFAAVFSGLFRETQVVSSIQAAAQEMPALDGIVKPTLEAFEFSLPGQAAMDQFAVWIRYNLALYGPDGRLLVSWPVAAYGESGSGGLDDEKAMERAVVLAMRDAAATVAVDFGKQPKVREFFLHASPSPDP